MHTTHENTVNTSTGGIKRAAAIHDLSGFGRCALTVVIPVLSAMGIQTVPMPTAVLSTHTGGFSDFSFLDLSEQMKSFLSHWKKLGIEFDAIYTGFLGSEVQFDIVHRFIEQFKRPETMVLIDPVLGDDGTAYATITPEMIENMKELIKAADIITPNITEAHFLLDMPFGDRSENEVFSMIERLSALGPSKVVITGWRDPASNKIGSICFDSLHNSHPENHCQGAVEASYPGTGDIFASLLLGKLMNGSSLGKASEFASEFVRELILDTLSAGTPAREGVLLEKSLKKLII